MERKRLYDLAFLGDRDADAIARERWFPQDLNQRFESRSKALGKWVISWVPYVFGYGEKLKNIFMLSVIVIIICSFLFMFQGFELSRFGEGENINRDLSFQAFELRGTFRDWFLSLYMSVITFSTLGYGDAQPVGLTRVVASMEALTGLVLMGFFVAILARKIIRG